MDIPHFGIHFILLTFIEINTFMYVVPHKNNTENRKHPLIVVLPPTITQGESSSVRVYISPCFRTECQLKAQVGLASSFSSTYLPPFPHNPQTTAPTRSCTYFRSSESLHKPLSPLCYLISSCSSFMIHLKRSFMIRCPLTSEAIKSSFSGLP